MPTQAPQNSAFYFQQAQQTQQQNLKNTHGSLETSQEHQASGHQNVAQSSSTNRTTKYSPMRKADNHQPGHPPSSKQHQQYAAAHGGADYHAPPTKHIHKVNYL